MGKRAEKRRKTELGRECHLVFWWAHCRVMQKRFCSSASGPWWVKKMEEGSAAGSVPLLRQNMIRLKKELVAS